MRLNEEQLSIIKEVRALMGADVDHPPRYICHALRNVLMARQADGTLPFARSASLRNTLSTAILAGINHMVTFGGFMSITCPVFDGQHAGDEYRNLIHMARLAWLDWIIHTGEIKPDFLLGEER